MTDDNRNHVSIVNVDMPFWSMVRFMVKWAVASIPAFIVLMMLAAVFWGVVAGLVASLSETWRSKPGDSDTSPPLSSAQTATGEQADEAAKDARVEQMLKSVRVTPVAMRPVERGFMTAVELKYSLRTRPAKTLPLLRAASSSRTSLGTM